MPDMDRVAKIIVRFSVSVMAQSGQTNTRNSAPAYSPHNVAAI